MAVVSIIEDDPRIRAGMVRALGERGHVVKPVATGMDGLRVVVDEAPDAVVLDLGLPDMDGTEVLRMIRAVSQVPVIVATARDDEAEIVRLLDEGADDYVVKPFSGEQLDARIRAVLRRAAATVEAGPLVVGGLHIDSRAREASLDGRPLDLTRKEFDLLAHLAARPGVVVTKAELLAEVWRQPYGGADKTVDVHLSWLRRKLGETATDPRYLRAVRGVGVKLVDPGP
ncbi:MAG: response regulator transcription factor [Acidimicrobiales bacterium]